MTIINVLYHLQCKKFPCHRILPQNETINFLRLLVWTKPVTPIKSFDKISDTVILLTISRIHKVLNSFQVCGQKKKSTPSQIKFQRKFQKSVNKAWNPFFLPWLLNI